VSPGSDRPAAGGRRSGPPPPPPPHHRAVGPLGGLAAALVLCGASALLVLPGHRATGATAGAGGGPGGSAPGSLPTVPTENAPVPPTTVAAGPLCAAVVPSPTSSRLPRLFIPAPSGFTETPDSRVGGGPLTATQLAAASSRPSAVAAELRRDGFEGAALRVWVDPVRSEQAQVTIVQFGCAAGAAEYFDAQVAGALGVPGGQPFRVEGEAAARGERAVRADGKGHYLQVVGVTSGPLYEEVATFTPGRDDGGFAGAISQLQLGRLGPA
jgi:hypothetical protein